MFCKSKQNSLPITQQTAQTSWTIVTVLAPPIHRYPQRIPLQAAHAIRDLRHQVVSDHPSSGDLKDANRCEGIQGKMRRSITGAVIHSPRPKVQQGSGLVASSRPASKTPLIYLGEKIPPIEWTFSHGSEESILPAIREWKAIIETSSWGGHPPNQGAKGNYGAKGAHRAKGTHEAKGTLGQRKVRIKTPVGSPDEKISSAQWNSSYDSDHFFPSRITTLILIASERCAVHFWAGVDTKKMKKSKACF